MESGVINTMCRCCASEGAFKDFKSAYHWMGEEEIYADMLKECFDITLSSSDNGDEGGICEVCITQLRNASNFKKQVILAEDQFKKHVNNKLFKTNIVKVEMSADEDSDGLSGDDGFAAEFEIPIKTEVPEEPKTKKRAAVTRATTSKAKKSKQDAGETSTKRDADTYYIEIEVDTSKMISNETHQAKPALFSEVHKHRENIRTILLSTNATPIGRYVAAGYSCCFCNKIFLNPRDLKQHTLTTHDEEEISTYNSNYTMINYIVKLDITYLHYLETLIQHENEAHEETKNMYRCDVCKRLFNAQKSLTSHNKFYCGGDAYFSSVSTVQ